MKSPTSRKCVQRVFLVLAAAAGFVLMAACGSSSSPPPNQQGFTNASLSGTYVFSASGTDVNGYPISIAGAFTANGSGGITAGTVDIVDPFFDLNGSTPPSSAAQSVSSGSYSVSTDGRGQLQLNIAVYGTYTFYFTLNSTSQGTITLYDKNHGTGSGTLDLQTAITSFTAGSYAFSLAGANSSGTALTLAGAFTLDSSGDVSGIEDYNNNGIVDQSFVTLTAGTAVLGSGTAPGQIPISTTPFPLTFDFYPIDNTHFKLVETDYIEFVSGDAFTQTGGSSIPTTSMAFTLSGETTSGAVLGLGGFMTVSGTSLSGTADVNDGGTFTGGTTFTGTASTPSTNGRAVLSSTSVGPASTLVLYPSADGVVLMELDSSAVGTGLAVQTASGTINASTGYAFNLSAVNISGSSPYEEDDNAQFTTNTSGGFTGIVDINDEGSLTPDQPLIGVYGTSTTTSGAYSVSTGIGTSTSNATEFVNFNAYPAASGQFLILETDDFQIGTGVFFAQTTPTSGGTSQAATRRIATVVRPQPAVAHTLGATIKKHNN